MKSTAIFRFDNTFEVWIPVAEQDPVTGQTVTNYVFQETGRGIVLPVAGGAVQLATREALPFRAAIRKVRDRNDTPIFRIGDAEYDMYVIEMAPAYDAFGAVVGYRHTLRREIPKSAIDVYKELVDLD